MRSYSTLLKPCYTTLDLQSHKLTYGTVGHHNRGVWPHIPHNHLMSQTSSCKVNTPDTVQTQIVKFPAERGQSQVNIYDIEDETHFMFNYNVYNEHREIYCI